MKILNNYKSLKYLNSITKTQSERMRKPNRWITTNEIERVIKKKLSGNKNPESDGFTGEFYQTFQ